jgi:hypothetical protein
MARTVQVFKQNGIEVDLRSEQQATDKRNAERKAE